MKFYIQKVKGQHHCEVIIFRKNICGYSDQIFCSWTLTLAKLYQQCGHSAGELSQQVFEYIEIYTNIHALFP